MMKIVKKKFFHKFTVIIPIIFLIFYVVELFVLRHWTTKYYENETSTKLKFYYKGGNKDIYENDIIDFLNNTLEDTYLVEEPIRYVSNQLHYESNTIKNNLRCMGQLNDSSTKIWFESADKYYKNVDRAWDMIKIDCDKLKLFENHEKFLKANFDFTSKKIEYNYNFNLNRFEEIKKKGSAFSLKIVPFFRIPGTDYRIGFSSPILSLNESSSKIPNVLHIDHEFFEVQIELRNNETYTKVYSEVYYNWQTSKMAESMKKKRFDINNNIRHLPYNVMILGVDSLASQHMERLLPKSFKYATNQMKFDYFRNSQVSGGNTYPNLMALLSGVMELNITTYTNRGTIIEEHDDQYLKNLNGYFDTLPFTWKLLPDYYTTVMIEDYYTIAMFNYFKKGFSLPPTNVYMRPFFIQTERNELKLPQTKVCDWAALFYELIDDYLEYIEREFKLDPNNEILLPFYFLSFHKRASHDNNVMVTTIDQKLERILKRLNQPIYLKNTLMFLYGDHGTRLDYYVFSEEGTIEKGKSTVLLRLPNEFLEDRSIFQKNTDRFVTPFDLHRTFLHLLRAEYNKENSDFFSFHEKLYTEMMHIANPLWVNKTLISFILEKRLRPLRLRGMDLFVEIVPWNRSCTEATSTNLYCSCNYFSTQKRVKNQVPMELKIEDKKFLNYIKKDFFDSIFPSYQKYKDICKYLQITEFKTLMINRINNTEKNIKEEFYLNQMIEISTRVVVNNNTGQFQLSYVVEEWAYRYNHAINLIFNQIYNLRRGLISFFHINSSQSSDFDKYLYWKEEHKLYTFRRSTEFVRVDKYALTRHCLNRTTKHLEKKCICPSNLLFD
ncbi:hypothetical protein SNEBB_002622 [Seison nebaliae]|nr:hypothetical protein SNEBB_002622 [Seison nebaliae]